LSISCGSQRILSQLFLRGQNRSGHVQAAGGIIIQWFRANREILVFEENEEVTDYLRPELQPFLDLGIHIAFPLISMDRLIGIVFMDIRHWYNPYEDYSTTKKSLSFEQVPLFKEKPISLTERFSFLKNYLIVTILYIGVVFSLSLVLFLRYDVR